jgi:hypothetical protein
MKRTGVKAPVFLSDQKMETVFFAPHRLAIVAGRSICPLHKETE